MMMIMLTVFVLGGIFVLAVEAVGIVIFIWWLMRRVDKGKPPEGSLCFAGDIDPSFYNKQGIVWVLESERILKALNTDKATKQHKAQKEILEVIPSQKFGKIKKNSLILIESDGSHTEIPLKGCMVAAVSASNLSTRKWAKRYPIKVESGASAVYKGSRIIYIYLETSWEKEAWCKALRLASCEDEEKIKWLAKLNVEFQNYLMSLNAAYPSFMKPSSSFGAEVVDKSSKPDGSSSKVRQFLKKLTKKASKNAPENKASSSSKLGHEERKLIEKGPSFQDLDLASSVMKVAPTRKPLDFSNEDVIVPSSTGSVISDADSDDRVIGDEGSLCWNLLISRLFFDAKRNEQMKSSLQERIQRTLSNIRSPSYIGEVTCAAVNVGDLPPYIHAMRVLPSDMNELWAFEIDVQYSGGAILDLETRLEVQDLDLHEGDEASLDSSVVDNVKSDLLEGFERFSEQFKHSDENTDKMDQRSDGDILARNFSTASRSSSCSSSSLPGSKWKSILHSVAKQVSQVPLSLGIRVASLRGTLRLYVKPPPSDQIWFGFTAMPDIDIHLNSSVGDRKISSGHLLLFITSRIKAAIRESVVLPNCENVCIPWMIAEKDDWVPLKDAPYIWIHNKSAGNAKKQEADRRSTSSNAENEQEKLNRVGGWATQKSKSLDPHSLYSAPKVQPSFRSLTTSPERTHLKSKKHHGETLQRKSSDPQVYLSVHMGQSSGADLHAPLMSHNEQLENHRMSTEENMQSYSPSPSHSLSMLEEQNSSTEDEMKPKRTGARAKMLGLRKKMGEKLEEKKRHIEEKGRHLVTRMRSHKEYS
ncbi:uncharacterized protein LOC125859671 isoform X1 [Solanum stenotomum]|uniref:uncharacterized protein LOC125859671 isoform X1 n=2 Tax=Solanum stenotomum TaxID=172797 RepID=UPI0020D06917|nr:uncharacterized protein LOC125859671 isoform X1 [Solanum stenotomum]